MPLYFRTRIGPISYVKRLDDGRKASSGALKGVFVILALLLFLLVVISS